MKKNLLILFLIIIFKNTCIAQTDTLKIDVNRLNESCYLFTSYKYINEYKVPANCMMIDTGDDLILIDTPWDENQTRQLLDWCNANLNREPVLVIVTHFHDDRVGGINLLKLNPLVKIIGTKLTSKLACETGYCGIEPENLNDTTMTIGNEKIQIIFPGRGHTEDNLVVYLPIPKILFGGCTIKSINSKNLGYIKDAYLEDWDNSLQKVQNKFNEAKIVIPGHGAEGDLSLIEHTRKLLKKKNRN